MTESTQPFSQLVVVGASAGGIEALSALVKTLPTDFPAPIVVAQHLSPHRASALGEILSRRGHLPVRTVTEREHLVPGVIFVVPSNRNVVIQDHQVLVQEDDGAGPRPSIDLLFRSAAEAYGEDLVAVILSGTGSDGAAGAREVKQVGGTVIIQNPETAAFPGMPLSLAPSTVDVVSNPDMIGSLLNDLLTGTFVVPRATDDNEFRTFLDQLREESGIDFTAYKQPTITRRLQRRMAATGQSTLADYVNFVRRHPDERQRLIASFLIKVTEFFRDPELFTYLSNQVLGELIADARQRGDELRLWSAGCATGEEAYTLAMIVSEILDNEQDDLPVRIFATDLDVEAVNFARHGVYPARALANLPPAMRERCFTAHNDEYEVKKALRSLLVFGDHDLGQRAPFPRIDLILCRNVLIYFTAALQRRALQLFAFSLRPNGYLALGKSETVSPLAEYFAVDQSHLKVFRRVGERAFLPPGRIKEVIPVMPRRTAAYRGANAAVPRLGRISRDSLRLRSGGRAEDVLLGLPTGVVVVNRDYDIQIINAVARRLFRIHNTALDSDFVHAVQHVPTASLRQAIDRALAGQSTTNLVLATDHALPESQLTIEISCYPISGAPEEVADGLVAVVASDVTAREHIRGALEGAEAKASRLAMTNDDLLSDNQELTGTVARLRLENEELLVGTEEIQAATEEVETLNEELQASNEELETLNEELQATVEELNTTNDDLQARTTELHDLAITSEAGRARLATILSSIGDAVFVVGEDGRTILANPAFQQMFGANGSLLPEDESGNPLMPDETPQQRAAHGERFSSAFTITSPDGARRWYEAEGHPVPGDDSAQRGVVTIRDITERSLRHLQTEWLAVASHELRTPLAATQAALQLAIRLLPGNAEEERSRRYLDQALVQARRIGSLVEQMVDASRLQASRLSLDLADVDLVPVVSRTAETSRMLARGQAIELETLARPLTMRGDEARIEQVLLNLLSNAITYAPNTERIDVRLRQVIDLAEIEVQDYGPGIAEDQLPGIFDRFRRLERGSHSAPGGLGLGLFIARAIVTGHGGAIDVQSTVGVGTTFTVRLPLLPSKLDKLDKPGRPARRRRTAKPDRVDPGDRDPGV